ncbi:hypothetical protein Tco_1114031, partial [Tanacetum coccineum]
YYSMYGYKTKTSALMLPLVKVWMVKVSSIVKNPVQFEVSDDWSIRMEALKCLSLFVLNFSRLAESQIIENDNSVVVAKTSYKENILTTSTKQQSLLYQAYRYAISLYGSV